MTAEEALALAKARRLREPEQPSVAGDVMEQGRSGFLTGLAQTGDMALGAIKNSPAGLAAQVFGGGFKPPVEEAQGGLGGMLKQAIAPDSGPLQEGLNAVSPDVNNPAQTTPGEYSRTIMNFLGGDLPFMGMGGPVRSAIGDVAGGGLSEFLGQRERASGGDETWARIIGAVVGSGSVAGLPTLRKGMRAGKIAAEKGFLPAIPGLPGSKAVRGAISPEALQMASDAFYDHLRSQGIMYNPRTWQTRLMQIRNEMVADPKIHSAPGPRRAAAVLEGDPAFQFLSDAVTRSMAGPLDFNDLQKLSSAAGDRMRDAEQAENKVLARAFRKVRDGIDDYMVNASGNLVYTNSSAPNALKLRRDTYKTAKALALRNIKQERLSKMLEKAQDYGHGDFLSGLTNQINAELRDSVDTHFWTEAEKKMLRDVRDGNTAVNTLGMFGVDMSKVASGGLPQAVELGRAAALSGGGVGVGGGYGLPALAGGTGSPLGLAVGLGTALAGTAANSAKPAIARGEMNTAMEAIRGGQLERGVDTEARLQSRRRARQGLALMHGINANGGTGEGTPMPGAIRG